MIASENWACSMIKISRVKSEIFPLRFWNILVSKFGQSSLNRVPLSISVDYHSRDDGMRFIN